MSNNEFPYVEGVREFQRKVKLWRSAAKQQGNSTPVVCTRDLH